MMVVCVDDAPISSRNLVANNNCVDEAYSSITKFLQTNKLITNKTVIITI